MFETQINNEYSKLTQMADGISASSFLSLTTIFSDEDFYSNFIEADASYQSFKSLTSLSAERVFPDNLYENSSAQEWLMVFLGKYSVINKDYISELLMLAVDMKFNYIIRPFTTLASFIFSDSVTISVKEAQTKLSYFSGHDYLLICANQVFAEAAATNGIITKSDFLNKSRNRLNDYMLKLSNEEIVSLSDDIYSFLANIDSDNFSVLSLMIFYDDIRIHGIVEKLDSLKDNYPTISQDNLLKLISTLQEPNFDSPSNDLDTEELLISDELDYDDSEQLENVENSNPDSSINEDIEIQNAELLTYENEMNHEHHLLLDESSIEDISVSNVELDDTDFQIDTQIGHSEIEGSLESSLLSLENSIKNLKQSDVQHIDAGGDTDQFKEALRKIYEIC